MTETKTMHKYKIIEYDGIEKLEASFGLVRPAGQARPGQARPGQARPGQVRPQAALYFLACRPGSSKLACPGLQARSGRKKSACWQLCIESYQLLVIQRILYKKTLVLCRYCQKFNFFNSTRA